MKHLIRVFILLFTISSFAQGTRLLRQPDINDSQITFTYGISLLFSSLWNHYILAASSSCHSLYSIKTKIRVVTSTETHQIFSPRNGGNYESFIAELNDSGESVAGSEGGNGSRVVLHCAVVVAMRHRYVEDVVC